MADGEAHVISGLGAQGDGVIATPQGEVHVAGALPGESVRRHGDCFARFGTASPARRPDPLCPHAEMCGGCSVQHMGDELYRSWKAELLRHALAQRGIDLDPAPMLSVPLRSRRRATFTGGWQDGAFALGFNRHRSHVIEPIRACAILSPMITAALPALTDIAARACPRGERVRVGVLAADHGLDVAMAHETGAKRGRARPPIAELARLAAAARILRLTLDGEPALQTARPVLTIAGVAVTPPPGAFVQAATESDAMLAELVLAGLGKVRRAADLFAGLGTLTFAIARRARVTAIDSAPELLGALAEAAARTPGLKPVTTLRRDLQRDPLSARELAAFDAVVLDPPRAGARAQCEVMAGAGPARIVMVSCNPATLARDLRLLTDGGYALESATPVDQFLFTTHLEAVAVLRRR